LIEGLAGENIYVAPRLGRMRISPHVYNDEADDDRFVAVRSKRLEMWGGHASAFASRASADKSLAPPRR
jgi:hypothetical protein